MQTKILWIVVFLALGGAQAQISTPGGGRPTPPRGPASPAFDAEREISGARTLHKARRHSQANRKLVEAIETAAALDDEATALRAFHAIRLDVEQNPERILEDIVSRVAVKDSTTNLLRRVATQYWFATGETNLVPEVSVLEVPKETIPSRIPAPAIPEDTTWPVVEPPTVKLWSEIPEEPDIPTVQTVGIVPGDLGIPQTFPNERPVSRTEETLQETVARWQRYWRKVHEVGGSSQHAEALGAMETWRDWMTRTGAVEVVALGDLEGTRFIGEVTTPVSPQEKNNQNQELLYLRNRWGYDGALVVWYGESPLELSRIVRLLKSNGFRVAFAYGVGETDLEPYRPANLVRRTFREILPMVDLGIPVWRGSSAPHWRTVREARGFANAVARFMREVNPDLPLLGEDFFTPDRHRIRLAVPGEAGKVALIVGYHGVSARAVGRFMGPGEHAALVIGPLPYYDTIRKDDLPAGVNVRRVCERIETGFLGHPRFKVTFTLTGDGFGSRMWEGKRRSDSLTASTWRKQ